MTMKNIIRLLALVAILTASALPASAQWGPEEEKNCFLNGKKGTITLSGQSNSAQGDSSKLEQFEEIPNGFLVPCAAYGWSNEKYFFDAKAIDALYDDQFLGATFGKKGGFQLDLTWDENPNWQSNTARTPYTETSPGVFDIPDATRLALAERLRSLGHADGQQPGGHRHGPGQPDRPRLLRGRGLRQHRACPRSTCATCARPAGPASASRWARPSSSTPATRARSGTATRTRPSTAAPTTRSRPRSSS